MAYRDEKLGLTVFSDSREDRNEFKNRHIRWAARLAWSSWFELNLDNDDILMAHAFANDSIRTGADFVFPWSEITPL